MPVQHVEYQAHFFSNNKEITPTPTNIGAILSNLAKFELIPTVGNVFEHTTNTSSKFIKMVTANEELQVHFMPLEIIVIYQSIQNQISLDEFIQKATEVFKSLQNVYPAKVANRLSIITNILNKPEKTNFDKIYNDFHNSDETTIPFEWYVRRCYSKDIENEKINSIYSLEKNNFHLNQVNEQGFDAIGINIDTNTVAQNSDFRFTFENCIETINSITGIHKELTETLLSKTS